MRTKIKKNCFVSGNSVHLGVYVTRKSMGEKLSFPSSGYNHLFFVLKGEVTGFDARSGEYYTVSEGECVLMGEGLSGVYSVISQDMLGIIYSFSINDAPCIRHFISILGPSDQTNISGDNECHTSMKIVPSLYNYLMASVPMLEGITYCAHFYDIKVDELFAYLREFYTPEELSSYFHLLRSREMDFKSRVISLYSDGVTLKDIHRYMDMTQVTFSRHFKRSFGVTPKSWFLQMKKESLIRDICMTDTNFSDIALKYDFSSSAYLTAFCRANWDMTPTDLRRRAKTGTDVMV